MILLCPKAFAGKDAIYFRDFLKYYLSITGKKAVIANEVWDSFRFRVKRDFSQYAEDIIVHFRGSFKSELPKLNEEFEEPEPTKDYNEQELYDKTKELIERKLGDIDIFITQEPTKYNIKNLRIMTLEEFYINCCDNVGLKELIEEFTIDFSYTKI